MPATAGMTAVAIARNSCQCVLALALLSGCMGSINDEPRAGALSAEAAGTTERIIVDMRIEASEIQRQARVIDAETEQSIIKSVYGTGAPVDVSVRAQAAGSFTRTDAAQTLYLLVRGEPQIVNPDVDPPMLAIFEGPKLVTQFVPTRRHYRDIASVVDIDGDGVAEVLLRANSYQMGHFISAIDLYSLKDGRKLIHHFESVYDNACDADVDAGVSAVTLAIDPDHPKAIRLTDFVAQCSSQYQAAPMESFKQTGATRLVSVFGN